MRHPIDPDADTFVAAGTSPGGTTGRRRFYRRERNHPVERELQVECETGAESTCTRELSAHGLFYFTPAPPPVGTRVRILLWTGPLSPIDLTGEISYRVAGSGARVDLDGGSLRSYQAFIEELAARHRPSSPLPGSHAPPRWSPKEVSAEAHPSVPPSYQQTEDLPAPPSALRFPVLSADAWLHFDANQDVRPLLSGPDVDVRTYEVGGVVRQVHVLRSVRVEVKSRLGFIRRGHLMSEGRSLCLLVEGGVEVYTLISGDQLRVAPE